MLRYLYYPIAVALAVTALAHALDAAEHMRAASATQTLDGATELAWKSLLEKLSFSVYSGAEDARAAYESLVARAAEHTQRAVLASLVLAALTGAQLVFVSQVRAARGGRIELAWHATLASAIAFGVGISAPMLTVLARSELPVLGTVVLKYDTKSILSTVHQLLAGGELLLAGLIGAFSIAVPLAKMVLMGLSLGPTSPALRARCLHVLHAIGKWSMADVFVVAVLVAFLALGKDELSDAQVGLGLYFFAAYCVLSLAAAQVIGRLPDGRGDEETGRPGAEA